jgi:hypothetical protein
LKQHGLLMRMTHHSHSYQLLGRQQHELVQLKLQVLHMLIKMTHHVLGVNKLLQQSDQGEYQEPFC